jgi:hypothetical protein
MKSESDTNGTTDESGGNAWCALLVVAYVSAFFIPHLVTDTTTLLPSYQDESQWLLYQTFINDSYSRGFFPLWTPHLFCGMPFLGWSHSAALYPGALIFAALDYSRGAWVNQWAHAVIYCLGVFYLCRRLGAGRWAAMAAILMEGALFIFGNLGNFLPNIRTGAWWPWLFLCAIGLLLDRRFRYLAGFILLNLLIYLGGQVELIGLGYEIFAVVMIGAGIYYRKQWRKVLAAYVLFAFAFILGFIMSLVQALPTLELTHFSIRGAGLTYEYFKIWSSVPTANLAAWVAYLGCGPVIVSVIAALSGARRSIKLSLLLLGLLFCVFLIHNLFECLWIIYQVPVLKGLLAHSRIYFHAKIIIAAIVALGIDHMFASERKKAWLVSAGAAGIAISALAWIFLDQLSGIVAAGSEPTMKQSLDHLLEILPIAMAGQALLGIILVAVVRGQGPRSQWFRNASPALLIIAVYSIPVLYSMPRLTIDRFRFPGKYERFFKENQDLYRTQSIYNWERWDEILIPLQSGVLFGTRSADGFITVSMDRYTRFLNAIAPGAFREEDGKIADLEATRVLKEGAFITDWNIPWLNFLGIRHLITERRNIKFSTHYFLAYPDSPLASNRGMIHVPKVDITKIGVGWPGMDLNALMDDSNWYYLQFYGPASIARGPIYLSEDYRLLLEARNDVCEHEYCTNWWMVITKMQSGEKKALDFARLTSDFIYGAPGIDLGGSPGVKELLICVVNQKLKKIPGHGDDSPTRVVIDPLRERWRQSTPGEGEDARPLIGKLWEPVIESLSQYFKSAPGAHQGFNIFENTGAMPPAFLVGRAERTEKEKVLDKLLEPGFDPVKQAVVEGAPVDILRRAPIRPGEGVTIDSYDNDSLEMTASAADARLLLLTDVYHPGWRVFVDGREDRIWPADYAFRGVIIEPGVHKLKMTYEPASFRTGIWVTLASLASLGFIAVIRRVNAKDRATDM